MKNKSQRFILMDGVRGVAALAVMIGHFTQRNEIHLFPSSTLAVDLFFCLSGFVIAWSYSERIQSGMRFFEYMKRRVIRLYPMFIMGLMMGLIAFFLMIFNGEINYSYLYGIKTAVINAFYIPYLPPNRMTVAFPLNSPAWSLFFELVANVGFFFVVFMPKRVLIMLTIAFGIWLVAYSEMVGTAPGWNTHNFTGGFPRVGYNFMAGVLIYRLYNASKGLYSPSPLALCLFLIVMLEFYWKSSYIYWPLAQILIIPVFVWFLTRSEVTGDFSTKFMEYIGWLSYPIYCIHVPMLLMFHSMLPEYKASLPAIFTCCGLIIVTAHVLGKYLDEPIRSWLSRARKPKSAATAMI